MTPPPPPPEITLDEWIAAGQACCGIDHDDSDDEGPDSTPPTPEND